MYRIGTILQATESRSVEYKAGGGNYPLTVLPSVCMCVNLLCIMVVDAAERIPVCTTST